MHMLIDRHPGGFAKKQRSGDGVEVKQKTPWEPACDRRAPHPSLALAEAGAAAGSSAGPWVAGATGLLGIGRDGHQAPEVFGGCWGDGWFPQGTVDTTR